MSAAVRVACALLLAVALPAAAHRLDEYLLATVLSLDGGRVSDSMRLVAGVAVAGAVVAAIDSNGDRTLSDNEKQAYARRVLADLSLRVDDQLLPMALVAARFPQLDEMSRGVGEIQLEFTAVLPRGGYRRRLVLENHHRGDSAVYLVNCLVPHDPDTRITAQVRSGDQSVYELDFEQGAVAAQDPVRRSGNGRR